jgi:hypothetical protein
MPREPIRRLEALAQAREALIDRFQCAHVSVLFRIRSVSYQK